MVKKAILLLSAVAGMATISNAQRCATDEVHREFIKKDPKVAEIQNALDMHLRGAALKTTAVSYQALLDSIYNDVTKFQALIPVVVHVVHDYGNEYISDNEIFEMIKNLNRVYAGTNTDLSSVIAPFKPYIGKAAIEFRLAQKDPQGKPTIGILRHYSYLTYGGDDQAKFNQWDPSKYLNIWLENKIGRGEPGGEVLAYATLPAGAANFPYNDGVISGYGHIDNKKTIEHEVGHYLNLYHPWNSSNQSVQVACGDDEVDDTPPTKGHFGCQAFNPLAGGYLYDTVCALGYKKVYPFVTPGSTQDTIDYPDTTNVENIMDYGDCPKMFTKQQVVRMRNTLKNSVAKRDNLITVDNRFVTGIAGFPFMPADLAPVADFSVEKHTGTPISNKTPMVYMCASEKQFKFQNRSWRDSVTNVQWEFTNGGASITQSGTQINSPVTATFTQPGWVTVKLTATSNAGTGTVEKQAVYAADPNYRVQPGYYQEFNAGEFDNWPSFNYYNNNAKWAQTDATGYYDKTSFVYYGYDSRVFPTALNGTPQAHPAASQNGIPRDYDDFFTPAYDLSGMTSGNCNINFLAAGVTRTTTAEYMNDRLELAYSTDCGASWKIFDSLKKRDLANNGTYNGQYAPQWMGEWVLHSHNIPEAARTSKTFFRFRYVPSTDPNTLIAVSNNFYVDRINVSSFPLGVNTILGEGQSIGVAPNPTSGSSFVVIQGNENTAAQVIVTDMTGKVVYRVQEQLSGKYSRIEIPASVIAVKGVYMVQVVTGSQTHTEKLVSY